jgi:hypothetical protein
VLAALAVQWDRVNGLLDDADRSTLHDLIFALGETSEEDDYVRKSLRQRIAALLFAELPKNDPVVELYDRLSVGVASSVDSDRRALASLAMTLRSRLTDRAPLSATRRILGAVWDTATDLRRRGVDPDVPDLIRLDHTDGRYAVPGFQFDGTGKPVPVVLRINEVLGARDDPWGAAYWWLSPNVWLTENPADLLGTTDPELLVAAAVAAVEG